MVSEQEEVLILYQGESCFYYRALKDLVVQDSYVHTSGFSYSRF